MTVATAIPLEEYLATSYEPDREYVDGQLLERNAGEHDHSRLQALLANYFVAMEKRFPIRVFTEQRVRVVAEGDRIRYRIPDVCVMLRPYRKERVLTEAPLIAIEILSPDDTMMSMMARLEDFRSLGIRHIWVVDPARRKVYELQSDLETASMSEVNGAVLTVTQFGVSVDFNQIFRELDQD